MSTADAAHFPGSASNGKHELLYRSPLMTSEHIGRFVQATLRELFNGEDSHYYDAIHIAFVESEIHPLAIFKCEHVHYDTLIERVNRFADELRSRLESDDQLLAAVSTIVTTVLNQVTIIAPETHPTSEALLELIQCCTPGTTRHIGDYDVYASLAAHVGSCVTCVRRLRSLGR